MKLIFVTTPSIVFCIISENNIIFKLIILTILDEYGGIFEFSVQLYIAGVEGKF